MTLQRLKDLIDSMYLSCTHPRITDVKILIGEGNEVLDIFDIKSSGDIMYLDTNMPKNYGSASDIRISYIEILANMLYLSCGEPVDMFLSNEFGDYMVHNHLSMLNGYSMPLVISHELAMCELNANIDDFYVENGKVYSSLGIDELKSKYELPRGIYNCLNEFMLSLK